MQLVAYGAQDIHLTGNPQITYFHVVYRRHTNFSIESIKQIFEGDTNFGNEVTVTISRDGDLLYKMYLEHDATFTYKTADQRSLNLVERYGDSLIKECGIEIGGQLIDRHTSMWNRVYSNLTESNPSGRFGSGERRTQAQVLASDNTTSNLPDLMKGNSLGHNTGRRLAHNYTEELSGGLIPGPSTTSNYLSILSQPGVAAPDSGNAAPSTLWDDEDTATMNGFTYTRGESGVDPAAAKIVVNKIFLPFNFWFCRDAGLALPLIALQYHEIKLRMTFEESSNLARESSGGAGRIHLETFPITNVDVSGNFDLWCDYIYLDTDERYRFSQAAHEYLIDQVQIKTTTLSESMAKIKLNFNHPVKELIWIMRNETVFSSGGGGRPRTKKFVRWYIWLRLPKNIFLYM